MYGQTLITEYLFPPNLCSVRWDSNNRILISPNSCSVQRDCNNIWRVWVFRGASCPYLYHNTPRETQEPPSVCEDRVGGAIWPLHDKRKHDWSRWSDVQRVWRVTNSHLWPPENHPFGAVSLHPFHHQGRARSFLSERDSSRPFRHQWVKVSEICCHALNSILLGGVLQLLAYSSYSLVLCQTAALVLETRWECIDITMKPDLAVD